MVDMGGHGHFFASHQALLPFDTTAPSINVVLISSRMEEAEMMREALGWGGFYACRVEPTAESLLPPFVLIATRADSINEAAKQRVLNTFIQLKEQFKNHFSFPVEPLFVDCRKSWSANMKEVRGELCQLNAELLKV